MKSFHKLSPDLSADLRAFRGRGVGEIMYPAAVSGKREPALFLETPYQFPLRDEPTAVTSVSQGRIFRSPLSRSSTVTPVMRGMPCISRIVQR